MKVFVCIKQVPGISEVKIDPKTNTLIRKGIPSILNPDDKHAIELAVSIKEILEAEVIVLSMGPPQAEEVLREALSTGADKAILLTDKSFAGADTLATSYVLSVAINNELRETEKYIVICGTQAIDGDTAQVGPELAEELNIPQITNVQKLSIEEDRVIAERAFRQEEIVVIETQLPVLISVLKVINTPRFPTIAGIVEAYEEKEVIHMNQETIKAEKAKIGLMGSQTEVWKIFVPKKKGDRIIIHGTTEQKAKILCQYLKDDKIL
ncbi:MAG: electron transfer flavoprotein subunit beta/FixA family protein [Promethearchaeota archaeon]